MAPLWIVDAAGSYQHGMSVQTLQREGFSAVVAKVSEGLVRNDTWDAVNKSWAKAWIRTARDVGMIPGAYHYLRGASGQMQAQYFVQSLDDITGNGAEGLLVQLDNEADATVEDTQSFVAEFGRLQPGHPLLMYTGQWWWGPRGWDGSDLTPYLWDSHYVMDGQSPASGFASAVYDQVPEWWWTPGYGGWLRATMLQFTSRASAGGLTSNVDASAYLGSIDSLRTLTTGVDMTPEQAQKLDDVWNRLIEQGWVGQSTFGRHNNDGTPATNFSQFLEGFAEAVLYGDGKRGPINDAAVPHSLNTIGASVELTREKIDALTVAGIDLDALADKVADKLAARINLVQKPAT